MKSHFENQGEVAGRQGRALKQGSCCGGLRHGECRSFFLPQNSKNRDGLVHFGRNGLINLSPSLPVRLTRASPPPLSRKPMSSLIPFFKPAGSRR